MSQDGSSERGAAGLELSGVVDLLRCPRCDAPCAVVGRAVRCERGHSFDLARQGYVNLTGSSPPAHADSPAMVAARAELLDSGRYAVITEALVTAVPPGARDLIDVGTGTGHYAAAVLDALPDSRALGLDISVAACRRAARRHPRLAVVTADAWAPLPVVDSGVDTVLSVFSPRNAAEFGRVLRPDGCVLTVTPGPGHLSELRATFGLLGVEDGKEQRLADTFGAAGLTSAAQVRVERVEPWTAADAISSVLMGPNAFHTSTEVIRSAADALDWPRSVTVSCVVTRWTR